MAEYNLIYMGKKIAGEYNRKPCLIIAQAGGDRVQVLFEDGKKLMTSRFMVRSRAKWEAKHAEQKMEPCPFCGGKGKVPVDAPFKSLEDRQIVQEEEPF